MIEVQQLIQMSNLISQAQFIFMMFNDLKCFIQMKIDFNSIIYALGKFSGSTHEKFDVSTKVAP